jgi:hypothetical protein
MRGACTLDLELDIDAEAEWSEAANRSERHDVLEADDATAGIEGVRDTRDRTRDGDPRARWSHAVASRGSFAIPKLDALCSWSIKCSSDDPD